MVVERSEPNPPHPHGEAPPARDANLEWRMGALVLDPIARILIHDGNPLPLGERAVSILLMLVERSGQLVSKSTIIGAAYPTRSITLIMACPSSGWRTTDNAHEQPAPRDYPMSRSTPEKVAKCLRMQLPAASV